MHEKTYLKAAMILALGGLILPNNAHARPDVRKMTCAQVKQTTRTKGAIVYSFTNTAYDRVVKNAFYCTSPNEIVENVYAVTLDSNRCNIGKRCTGRLKKFRFGGHWDKD